MDEKKILIVEDELITAMELVHFLKKAKYQPILTNSSEEAIKNVVETHPDLIIMNVRLHGKDEGIDTVKKIKKLVKVPVIYLTAHTDKKILNAVELTNPSACILKPFDWDELIFHIENALYKYHEMMEKKDHDSKITIFKFYAMVGTFLASSSDIQEKKFPSDFSSIFEVNMKEQFITNFEDLKSRDESKLFHSYMTSISKMFSNLGFLNNRMCNETIGYMVINTCPWKYGGCSDSIFCSLCHLLTEKTMSWTYNNGKVIMESSMINGENYCGFKFELDE